MSFSILEKIKNVTNVEEIYREFNATDIEFAEDTLISLFENSVKMFPDNIAVKNGEDCITYKILNTKADAVAAYLYAHKIEANDKVGVIAARSIETIINIIGILKVGASYVPIDPEYPDERRAYIVGNSNCKIVLDSNTYCDAIESDYGNVIVDTKHKFNNTSLAYTIYTSGSTGLPKGVEISHKAVVNTIVDVINKFSVNSNDKIIALSSMCFDLSVFDIFGALSTGATLVQIDDPRDISDVRSVIINEKITIWNSIPSTMDLLLDNSHIEFINNNLRLVLLSGDWISLRLPDKIRKVFPKADVISLGGATEAAIWSIYYPIKDVDKNWLSIPYGYPLGNQKIYVLNYEKKLCPCGIEGEIYIGGQGVAERYANDPEKTNDSFIQHKEFGKLYKTGDYGVMTSNRYIQFNGRKDNQIKLHGYRIELGEIEGIMKKYAHMKNAVVAVKKNATGSDILCGYYVMEEKYLNDLIEYMGKYLPEYMIPTEFMKLDEIPLTENGKIDRKNLPNLNIQDKKMPKEHVARQYSDLEEKLLILFRNVYSTEGEIDIYDNFFEMGLNSILMVNLISEIENQFGIKLKFKDFLKTNNIHELSEMLSKTHNITVSQKVEYKTSDMDNLYEPFPISDVQMAYLMGRDEAFEMGGTSTHAYGEIETELDMRRFNDSLQKVINRHPVLRSIILPNGTQQILKNTKEYKMDIENYSNLSEAQFQERVLNEREKMSHHVFKTDEWPLFTFKAFKTPHNTNYLFVELDLLIGDGMSMRILVNEIMEYYYNPDLILPDLKYTFRDYMLAMEEFRTSEKYKAAKEYWISKINSFPEAPAINYLNAPKEIKNPHFERVEVTFGQEKLEKLRKEAKSHSVTLSAVICTAFAKVLAYWSNQLHLSINLTVFNRQNFHPDVSKLIGDFTSTMLLDVDLRKNSDFWRQCQDIQNVLMEALEYKDYNGVEFIREIAKARHMENMAIMPIVFTSMIFDNVEKKANHLETFGVTKYEASQTSQVFLDFQASDDNGVLKMSWDYVMELFDKDMINEMFEAYTQILDDIINNEACIEIILPTVSKNIINKYNNEYQDIPDKLLYECIYENAKNIPDQIAVKRDLNIMTYKQLNIDSNKIAHYLEKNGIKRNDKVCVLAKRCPETIAMIYGILKSGAAYVPIDPDYPEERVKYIMEKSEAKFFLQEYPACEWMELDSEDLVLKNESNDLAYIIFTSGSTGMPKGVEITHKAAFNTIFDINKKYFVNQNDRILGISSMCFDLSVYDIFGIHIAGGALVQIQDSKDINSICEKIINEKITIYNSVPALMNLVVDNMGEGDKSTLRVVLLSGDWIPLDLPKKVKEEFKNALVVSLGGATESAIWSIYYEINKELDSKWNSIPYGKPLKNQKIYILNTERKLCPVGVTGEIYIGGMGVALGYSGNRKLTDDAFIEHSLGRIYKTGDYGILCKEGVVKFLGRQDLQVKIGGYRIELEEIQNQLIKIPQIKDAVVIDQNLSGNQKCLCAYLIKDKEIDNSAIKKKLLQVLPGYMVPDHYIEVSNIPLTYNGKVDRKSLPAFNMEIKTREKEIKKPQTSIEKEIYEIWKRILGIQEFSIEDDFYSLGGHSISMINILALIEKNLKVKISYKEFIENCTVEKSAGLVAKLGDRNQEVTFAYPEVIIEKDKLYDEFSLTDIQMAYLVGRNTALNSGGLSTHMYTEFETELDIENLELALNKTIMRHEMLRAIVLKKGKQKILKSVPEYKIYCEDISMFSKSEQERKITEKRGKLINHVFDTEKWPLFNFEAYRLSDNRNYLFVEFDQLIADGTSIQIIANDLLDFYFNPEKAIENTELTFRDYMVAYDSLKNTTKYLQDKEYWLNKLDNFPSAPDLPINLSNLNKVSRTFKRLSWNICKNEYDKLKDFAKAHKVTVSAILCAAYAKTLSDWSNQDRLALNLTFFNRYPIHPDVNKIVGDFTSVLLLDIDMTESCDYVELSLNVQRTLAEAMEHKTYEGIEFIRNIAKRDNAVNQAIMPIVFTSMLFGSEANTNRAIGVQKFTATQTSQVYLDHQANDFDGSLHLSWDYVSELFEEQLIVRMFEQYIGTINNIIDSKPQFFSNLSISEMAMIEEFNDKYQVMPDKSLIGLFENSCKEVPNNIAIIDVEKHITYAQLNSDANRIANYLSDNGVGVGSRVAIVGHRDHKTIAALLGILKTGAAYVPMDQTYPIERRNYIIKNSECKLVLDAVSDWKDWEKYPNTYHSPAINTETLAYIIYTSGSTGYPKGVMISNKAAVNTILDINQKFDVTSRDRIAGISSLCFDLSVYDIFGTFGAGATLVIIKDQRNVQNIIETMNKYNITVWNSVPAIMDMTIQYMKNISNSRNYIWANSNVSSKEVTDRKFFWSPLAVWKKDDNESVIINDERFDGDFYSELFPEFYFFLQDGKTKNEIREHFKTIPNNEFEKIFERMIAEEVIIDSIIPAEKLFATQDRLYQHTYGQDLIYKKEAYDNFKKQQMCRHLEFKGKQIALNDNIYFPEEISCRESVRKFDAEKLVPFDAFSAAISVFKQKVENNKYKYNYSSAGGLYPIDIFVYVKTNRVEKVEAGLYYYNPIDNNLTVVKDGESITADAHYFTNKEIFNNSAFSIFFIYNASVSMPRYGGAGYEYAFIDTGIMVELFTHICEYLNLGMCSIGDMNFDKIKSLFNMSNSQIWIHTVECGVKMDRAEVNLLPYKEKSNLINQHFKSLNKDLRLVLLSGDWIPTELPDKIKQYAPNSKVISLGGATEGSIWSIFYPIDKVESHWTSIPYGYPLANQKIYIMNSKQDTLPVNVKGEICIGGVGVAMGYCNDEDKTKEAFVKHQKYGKLYKTGDYGILRESGYIEFCGRKDFQIKLNGYRIELEEVEKAIRSYADVIECLVNVQENEGVDYLVAYIVSDKNIDKNKLKEKLGEMLPEYMIPRYYMQIEKVNLSRNGKLDRKALPAYVFSKSVKHEKVYPCTKIEKEVCNLIGKVLDMDDVSMADDFFEIGGDSLKATEVVATIETMYSVNIGFEIFANSKISDIANVVTEKLKRNNEQKGRVKNIKLIKEGTDNSKKIFLFSEVRGKIEQYYTLCSKINPNYYCYGVVDSWFSRLSAMDITIEEIAKAYVSEILDLTDSGDNICLCGWSFGGIWAFEVAKQIMDRRNIICVNIIDSLHPGADMEVPFNFTLEQEKEIVRKYISTEIETADIDNTETLWHEVIKYFKNNNDQFEIFKNSFGDMSFVLHEKEPEESIKQFNLFRTLSSAQSRYCVKEKINLPSILIKANNSFISMNTEAWEEVLADCSNYNFATDHIGIIMEPVVNEWIDYLNEKLK